MKYLPILISAFVAAVTAAPQDPSAVAPLLPRQSCVSCVNFGNGFCGDNCGNSWACSGC
uniref:Cassiicolin n=1 Tax=Corynespora cassiicola TaxID=59586 RepID=K9LDV9_CORCC|nr:cassiicolin precursor [Corynespora cassiicola]AFH88926.1 cassiicolin precursor [Corynespora cassiicola]AJF23739.1 cassiicolin precursor [Corynespora cassiicola]